MTCKGKKRSRCGSKAVGSAGPNGVSQMVQGKFKYLIAKQHWRSGSNWRSQRIAFPIPPTSLEGFQRILGELTGELGEHVYTVSRNLCILRKQMRKYDPKEEPTGRAQAIRVMSTMLSRYPKLREMSFIILIVDSKFTLAGTLNFLSSVVQLHKDQEAVRQESRRQQPHGQQRQHGGQASLAKSQTRGVTTTLSTMLRETEHMGRCNRLFG